jgi:putative Mg2+ transporter-C (MgtC) family protein
MSDVGVLEAMIRIAIAAGLGGALGIEREFDNKDAGFRTHLLLAVGAAVFGVVSVAAFDTFVDRTAATNVRVDVTRIASYVAAGVGFIGGGAILKSGRNVRGLTTAASLWTAAAIGLTAGLGLLLVALGATVLSLVALFVLRPVSRRISLRAPESTGLDIELSGADDPDRVLSVLASHDLRVVRCSVHSEPDQGHDINIRTAGEASDDQGGLIVELSDQLRHRARHVEIQETPPE